MSLYALPIRGGGRGGGFTWEETAQQIRLQVLVDPSVKASDVLFLLEGRRLQVKIRGHAPLLQGTLRVGLSIHLHLPLLMLWPGFDVSCAAICEYIPFVPIEVAPIGRTCMGSLPPRLCFVVFRVASTAPSLYGF